MLLFYEVSITSYPSMDIYNSFLTPSQAWFLPHCFLFVCFGLYLSSWFSLDV